VIILSASVIFDDNKIINRIIARLKADTRTFEKNNKDKARKILFGSPSNKLKMAQEETPYIYVTTPDSLLLSSRSFGVFKNTSIHQNTSSYEIVIIAGTDKEPQQAERQLYEMKKNVAAVLGDDPTLSDPDDPGNDQLVNRSVVNDIPWDSETRGWQTQAVRLVLVCTIGTEQTINIPGVGILSILGITPDADSENWQPHFDTKLILKGYAPLGSIRTLAILIIYDRVQIEALRTVKTARNEINITITDVDGVATILKAVISNIDTSMAQVDDIKTTAIQFNIIPN